MNLFDATMIIEGQFELAGIDTAQLEDFEVVDLVAEAGQLLINTGAAWTLQGAIGRACMNLVDAGVCYLPETTN